MAILEPIDDDDDDDELPELPEEIIQYILSLVPIKDGARASCLSKTWLNAWRTRSILHFDEYACYLNPRNSWRGGFLHYGNRCLQRYRDEKIGIENFKLHFRTPIVSEWIQVAIGNDVKRLELVAHCSSIVLPGIIFEAKSPKELSVEGCGYSRLKLPKSMTKSQNLIKSLHLHSLELHSSDLQSITSICPMIEELVIWDCILAGSFKVTNLSKLKQFNFMSEDFYDQTVEVEALPNLEFLYCYGFHLSMNTAQNLKQLELFEVGITDEFFLDFKYRFPNLEDLSINCNYCNLQQIRISSISLRKMELNIDYEEFLKEVDIDAPNMTWFELNDNWNHDLEELQINAPSMTWFKYRGSFIRKVSFTSSSSNCCSHIYFEHPWVITLYFVELKKFLKNFSQSKIYLHLGYELLSMDYDIFDVKEAMDMDSFAAVQVHHLILPIPEEKFLDGIFWTCSPKTIRIECWTHYSIQDSITNVSSHKCSEMKEFISKYLMMGKRDPDDRGGSSHIKFWKRSVKKMIFQEFSGQSFEHVLELEMET